MFNITNGPITEALSHLTVSPNQHVHPGVTFPSLMIGANYNQSLIAGSSQMLVGFSDQCKGGFCHTQKTLQFSFPGNSSLLFQKQLCWAVTVFRAAEKKTISWEWSRLLEAALKREELDIKQTKAKQMTIQHNVRCWECRILLINATFRAKVQFHKDTVKDTNTFYFSKVHFNSCL